MRRHTYILISAALILFSGCVKDQPEADRSPIGGGVTLNISLPAPVTKSMTRAVPSEYETIKDLNIIIASGSSDDDVVTHIFYIGSLDQAGVDAAFEKEEDGDELVTYSGSSGGTVGIHLSKEWFEHNVKPAAEAFSENCAFFVLANWGNKVGRDTGRVEIGDTVEHLREVKVERRDYAMFGGSVDIPGGHSHANGRLGRSLEIVLKRMVAMFTVKIDGTHLGPGVEIIPIDISLHNVPNYGTFDAENVMTEPDSRTTPLTDENGVPMILPNGPTVGVSGWGTISNLPNHQQAGGHYTDWDPTDWDPEDDPMPNIRWDNPTVQPLFMYENYHGKDFGEPIPDYQQAYKRPAASIVPEGSYTGDTPTREQIAAVTGACSYIQVRANYRNTVSGDYGTVAWRLFLGGNSYDDFNVMRNTYYRITLDLNGGAIGESDYSWRVSSNLGKLEIIGESDIIINGGGNMVLVEVPMSAQNGNAQFRVELDTNNPLWSSQNPFAWINRGESGTEWIALGGSKEKYPNISVGGNTYNFQFWLFIQPMVRNVTWNGTGHVRRVRFRLVGETNSPEVTEWITITQYEPIAVTVEADYSSITDDDQREKMQAIRDYARDVLRWTLPRTFFIDRVDNTADEWGFESVNVPSNSNSGLANGNYLLGLAQAGDYRPNGAGSAMMHAAFMPYYQRSSPLNGPIPYGPNITIGQLRAGYAATPSGYPTEFFIPSIAEWRLIDMLYEADVEVEDPTVSAIIWNDYWTSDALPGTDQAASYVFGMGHPEEIERPTLPRTTPTTYRMMYFKR